jgi:hypothetical protein
MITVSTIRKYLDRLTKKEQRGNMLSGEDFNTFLAIAQAEYFDQEKRKAEATGDVIDSLRSFVTTLPSTATSGVLAIPTNPEYVKLLQAYRYNSNVYYPCDLVSQMEKGDRLTNSLTIPSNKYPIVSIEGSNFVFNPTTSAPVKVVYLKRPADPFLDFYYDQYRNIVYMEADTNYTITAPQEYRDGTTGTKASLTEEFEWADDMDIINIAYILLVKLGKTIPDNLAIELGSQKVMESTVKV